MFGSPSASARADSNEPGPTTISRVSAGREKRPCRTSGFGFGTMGSGQT